MLETKLCPFCAEEINSKAIKCKHCKSLLENQTLELLNDPVPIEPQVNIIKEVTTGYAAIVDVETTGFNSEYHEVIELGLILFSYDKETGDIIEVVKEYSGLREPTRPIPRDATKVHGLARKDVKGHFLDNNAIAEICETAEFFIAHNAKFDYTFVIKLFYGFKTKDWYCTMESIDWMAAGAPNRKLKDIVELHKIENHNPHRAISDAQSVLQLLKTIKPTGSTYFQEMIDSGPMSKPKKQVPEKYQKYRNNNETNRIESTEASKGKSALGCVYVVLFIMFPLIGLGVGDGFGFFIGLLLAVITTISISSNSK